MSNFQDLAEESQLNSKLIVLVKYMIPVVILELIIYILNS